MVYSVAVNRRASSSLNLSFSRSPNSIANINKIPVSTTVPWYASTEQTSSKVYIPHPASDPGTQAPPGGAS